MFFLENFSITYLLKLVVSNSDNRESFSGTEEDKMRVLKIHKLEKDILEKF